MFVTPPGFIFSQNLAAEKFKHRTHAFLRTRRLLCKCFKTNQRVILVRDQKSTGCVTLKPDYLVDFASISVGSE
jgi:hypothetical protein